MKELVVDLSYHNGTVNFSALKNAGVYGVILRAGYGKLASQKDKKFEEYYKGASEVGLHIGTYWYSYAKSVSETKVEMNVFMNVIKDKKFDMFVAFDLEDSSQTSLGKETLTSMAVTALDIIHSNGYQTVLYTNPNWLMNYLYPSKMPSYSKYWVACYSTNKKYDQYVSSSFCAIHQYSETGTIAGIKGNVDMNHLYYDFVSNNEPSSTTTEKKKVEMYTKDSLNIRAAASLNAAIVTTYTKGTPVTVVLGTEKIVGKYEWIQCIINNEELWCAKTYLSNTVVPKQSNNLIEVKPGTWNVRKEPRVSSRVIKILKGDKSYEYSLIRSIGGIKWYYVTAYAGWICGTGVKRTYVG